MALLRQNGCPSVFLTMNCNEFDWPRLLKEILETVHRRKVTEEEIENLSNSGEEKKYIRRCSIHFQKRIGEDVYIDGK